MKLVALALASLIGFAGIAHADDLRTPYDRPQVRQAAPLRAAIVARFDRDGDGRLSPQERRHAAKALRRMARKLARQDRRAERQGRQGRGQEPRVDVDVSW